VGHLFGIILGFVGLVFLVLAGAGVAMFRTIKSRSSPGSDPDEARLIQELHQGMSRLEGRVESLEAILMDQQAQDKEEK
jgi:phage shock protein B